MKVTVMIPTYNQEKYIAKAIESALAQRYENLEVIVSDDASTDATYQIAQSYAHHARLKCHRNERNLGRTANYRKLLYELAQGEWVLNLDGDDYLNDPYFISHAVSLIGKVPDLKVVAGGFYVTNNEKLTYTHLLFPDTRIVAGKDLLLQWDVSPIGHLAALYHRASALELDFYRADIISSDWESMLRLILKGNVACLNRPVATWRLHGQNESQAKSLRPYIADASYIFAIANIASAQLSPSQVNGWKARMLLRHFAYAQGAVQGQSKARMVLELWQEGKLAYLRYFPFMRHYIDNYRPKALLARMAKAAFGMVGLQVQKQAPPATPANLPPNTAKATGQHWIDLLGINKLFDIGANQGQFLGDMIQKFPQLQYYCFEPLPDCFSILKENFKQYPQINFFNCALGASKGKQTIHRNAFSLSSSLLPMHQNHQEAFPFTQISFEEEIELNKLDDFAHLIQPTDKYLLKIDVQGYEMEVIKGGPDIVKNATAILIEVSFKEMYEGQAMFNDIYQTMLSLGFTYHGHFDQLSHPKTELPLQADAIFIRQDTATA